MPPGFFKVERKRCGNDRKTVYKRNLANLCNEADMALIDQRWEKYGPSFLKRLSERGLLSYERAQVWNRDSKLVRFVIFRYESAESVKQCAPIWIEVEETIFKNAGVKVIAYRGVSIEYWTQENS